MGFAEATASNRLARRFEEDMTQVGANMAEESRKYRTVLGNMFEENRKLVLNEATPTQR